MPCSSQWSIGHRPLFHFSPSISVFSRRLLLSPVVNESCCAQRWLQISSPGVPWLPSSSVASQSLFGNAFVIPSQCMSKPNPFPSFYLFQHWFLISFVGKSLLLILSGQCMLTVLRRHFVDKNGSLLFSVWMSQIQMHTVRLPSIWSSIVLIPFKSFNGVMAHKTEMRWWTSLTI